MSVRIGLGIGSDAVRAVCVRDSALLWAREVPLADGDSIEIATGRLLDTMTLPRWPRARVVVAVGPRHAQTKRLTGLPELRDPRALARVVSEGTSRFFLRNGVPLATSGVRRTGPGEGWATAIEEPVMCDVASVCRRRGLSLVGFVPTVAVIGRALTGDRLVWEDGDVAAELTLKSGVLEQIRRIPTGYESGAGHVATAPLASLGVDGWRYADAYGAAVTRTDDTTLLRPGVVAGSDVPVPGWRLTVASAALVATFGAATAAPGLAGARSARESRAEIAAAAPARGATARTENELRSVTTRLTELGAFAVDRRSATRFMAQLTEALPADVQLVTVRLDSAGGNLVALAARAAQVVTQLETLDDVDAPEVVGPVTREQVAGREKERVTVRFRWSRREAKPAPATTQKEALP